MVNPSYNGSFKFPSSTRSIGARKGGLFSRGNRQQARQFNFNRRNPMPGAEDDSCPSDFECWDTFFSSCQPC